jgi:hypothetical protein
VGKDYFSSLFLGTAGGLGTHGGDREREVGLMLRHMGPSVRPGKSCGGGGGRFHVGRGVVTGVKDVTPLELFTERDGVAWCGWQSCGRRANSGRRPPKVRTHAHLPHPNPL